MPGREGKRVEETEPEVEREHSWALQRLITHFSRPVTAHARTAPPTPTPTPGTMWSCRGVKLHTLRIWKETDNLKIYFCFSSGSLSGK